MVHGMGSSPFGGGDGIRTHGPHLGKVFWPNLLTCDCSTRGSDVAVFDDPGLSASNHHCQWCVVFPWCGVRRISYHVHHIDGDISEQLTGVCFASAPRGTSPSVANRLSNSLTPRAPCRWRAVVGGVDQRSTAGASPNHRRLPLGFGHLPSPSSVVRTYPQMRPVWGDEKKQAFDPFSCPHFILIGDLADGVWRSIRSSSLTNR
jgi:hypothetical protein